MCRLLRRHGRREERASPLIETTILAGREPDWDALAARHGRSITDAELRARGLTQEDIDRVRSYYA
jgi:hypothetical protein